MHELLKHVLTERDLTRAGKIFSIPDCEIVDDLNEVLKQITEISSRPDYCRNDRDQSLIEICVTRVTSCVKETGTLEKYCVSLMTLLESCLHHDLMPVGTLKDDDPPHAKIASDIIACIVRMDKENSYSNKNVMKLFLPVAVQFLNKGNREISRHMARYLSLAAIHHAMILKPHVHTIMDSIMSGNYTLCRILKNLYEVSPGPLEDHIAALISLLPHAEQIEKNSLFALFEQIAERRPVVLAVCLPQLLSNLCPNTTPLNDPSCMCMEILEVVFRVSRRCARAVRSVGEVFAALHRAARPPHCTPRAFTLIVSIFMQIGYTNKDKAQEALNFILEHLPSAERVQQAALMREATSLCSAFPALFTDKLVTAVRANNKNRPKSAVSQSEINRTSGGVTIVKLGGGTTTKTSTAPSTTTAPPPPPPVTTAPVVGYTRRAKLGDSRSTGRLHTGPNPHRSMTRLNVGRGSIGGLHKSLSRLTSSQQINSQQISTNSTVVKPSSSSGVSSGASSNTASGSTTYRPSETRGIRPQKHHHNILIGPAANISTSTILTGPSYVETHSTKPLIVKSTDALVSMTSPVSIQHSNKAIGNVSVITPTASTSATAVTSSGSNPVPMSGPVTVTRRVNNTSVTMINASNANTSSNHRISVFEPYPMRDTIQHFCEKHLDKIKAYMENVSLKLPPPAKCTIEERRSKKMARLQFGCGLRGPHCLYSRALFSVHTRAPRVWIHLMFLALQSRHAAALSARDPTVASLKHCWDILKCENKTFLTLVTGAFPAPKDHEALINELSAAGLFDVFEVNDRATWGCFLCTRPERARGFISADGQPVIEGQLKEKKGRWRLFRRWRTRYFTLSGAHLSCKGSSGGESIDINQIRSVKVSRGARNIPKAFEIFTGDQTLILKPKDGKNAEEWVQCLSIALAHSQAKDTPAKANSLPARGITLKSF